MEQVGVKKLDDLPDFEDRKDVTPDVIELPDVAEVKPEAEEVPLPFDYGQDGQGQIDESWMK